MLKAVKSISKSLIAVFRSGVRSSNFATAPCILAELSHFSGSSAHHAIQTDGESLSAMIRMVHPHAIGENLSLFFWVEIVKVNRAGKNVSGKIFNRVFVQNEQQIGEIEKTI